MLDNFQSPKYNAHFFDQRYILIFFKSFFSLFSLYDFDKTEYNGKFAVLLDILLLIIFFFLIIGSSLLDKNFINKLFNYFQPIVLHCWRYGL